MKSLKFTQVIGSSLFLFVLASVAQAEGPATLIQKTLTQVVKRKQILHSLLSAELDRLNETQDQLGNADRVAGASKDLLIAGAIAAGGAGGAAAAGGFVATNSAVAIGFSAFANAVDGAWIFGGGVAGLSTLGVPEGLSLLGGSDPNQDRAILERCIGKDVLSWYSEDPKNNHGPAPARAKAYQERGRQALEHCVGHPLSNDTIGSSISDAAQLTDQILKDEDRQLIGLADATSSLSKKTEPGNDRWWRLGRDAVDYNRFQLKALGKLSQTLRIMSELLGG